MHKHLHSSHVEELPTFISIERFVDLIQPNMVVHGKKKKCCKKFKRSGKRCGSCPGKKKAL